MSKFQGYDNYCLIDVNNKTANCGDKYNNIQTHCTPVKDNIKTFYDNTGTPNASLDNQILAIARNPNIDYNYLRASKK
jgi:putative aminopeptidase FrvX